MEQKFIIMEQEQDHLKALQDIRTMMDRSSRFISLSGLSGVFAGIIALAGAAIVYYTYEDWKVNFLVDSMSGKYSEGSPMWNIIRAFWFYIVLAIGVLVLSIGVSAILTARNSKKKGIPIWGPVAERMIINMIIPLITGGFFCGVLLFYNAVELIAPSTLIFYGLALLNASKYTLNDIRYLGISEILIGMVACFFPYYGLMFWALGFGVLHIIYGTIMYVKYERN
jgi:hypothetical protein